MARQAMTVQQLAADLRAQGYRAAHAAAAAAREFMPPAGGPDVVTPAGGAAEAKHPLGKAEQAAANDLIRVWAKQHKMKVSDRGRIPAAVMRAYENAHT
jgi:Lsr2